MALKVGDKVFITKWALSSGICEGRVVNDRLPYPSVRHGNGYTSSFLAKDLHLTIDSAQARVQEMVAAKLKSLEKQRAKLEKIARDGARVIDGGG